MSEASIDTRDRFSRLLDRSLGAASALVLAALVALTFCDVVGRYFLNSPIYGAYELVELMMGALIFTALPVVTERNFHVTIDLLDPVTPARMIPVRDAFLHALSAAVLATISWQLWKLAAAKASYGDLTTFLNIPLYPVAYGMSVLSGLTAAVSVILLAIETVGRFTRSQPAPPAGE